MLPAATPPQNGPASLKLPNLLQKLTSAVHSAKDQASHGLQAEKDSTDMASSAKSEGAEKAASALLPVDQTGESSASIATEPASPIDGSRLNPKLKDEKKPVEPDKPADASTINAVQAGGTPQPAALPQTVLPVVTPLLADAGTETSHGTMGPPSLAVQGTPIKGTSPGPSPVAAGAPKSSVVSASATDPDTITLLSDGSETASTDDVTSSPTDGIAESSNHARSTGSKGEKASDAPSAARTDAAAAPFTPVQPVPPSLAPLSDLAAATVMPASSPPPNGVLPAHTLGPTVQPSSVPTTPYTMVPLEIGLGALQGRRMLELRLSPEDLGTIEIRLDVSSDSTMKADIRADRADTLAMMMRDAPALRHALDQTGMTTTPDSLSFSLRQDSQSGAQSGAQFGTQSGQNPHQPPKPVIANKGSDEASSSADATPFPALPLRRVSGLLDLQI
jgi:flagellar hook-length control protein FliK